MSGGVHTTFMPLPSATNGIPLTVILPSGSHDLSPRLRRRACTRAFAEAARSTVEKEPSGSRDSSQPFATGTRSAMSIKGRRAEKRM